MINEARKVLIEKDDPSRGFINIRVGFHSGPVVSNVIGTTNKRCVVNRHYPYDNLFCLSHLFHPLFSWQYLKRFSLFGDTVNTSSRMESNSTANRILCSERSYELLKQQAPHIKTKKRGKIQVKGKGDMHVYWVGDNLLKQQQQDRMSYQNTRTVGFAEDFSERTDEHTHPEPDTNLVSPNVEMLTTTFDQTIEQAPEQALILPQAKVQEMAHTGGAPENSA